MKVSKLIKGEQLLATTSLHGKAYAVGSELQWGTNVWEVVESPCSCEKCYFHLNGKCYRTGVWIEDLGECTAIARPDCKDIAFQLRRQLVIPTNDSRETSCSPLDH